MKTLFDEYGSFLVTTILGIIVLDLFCGIVFDKYFYGIKEYIRYEEVINIE